MGKEPKSDLVRYGFGFSSKKPERSFWYVIAFICVVDLLGMIWTFLQRS